MTDRVKGLTITFDRDIRVDDVEHIINAVKMIKGVAHVENHITTTEDHFYKMRYDSEMRQKLFDFIQNELTG